MSLLLVISQNMLENPYPDSKAVQPPVARCFVLLPEKLGVPGSIPWPCVVCVCCLFVVDGFGSLVWFSRLVESTGRCSLVHTLGSSLVQGAHSPRMASTGPKNGMVGAYVTRSPRVCPFANFLWGGFYQNRLQNKVGTRILLWRT